MAEGVLSGESALSEMPGRRLAWGLPPLPSNLVLRRRLFPKLNAAVNGGLTVATGPPGSGKSALVSGWARYTDPGDVIWLTLSADDDCEDGLWERVHLELSRLVGAERLDSALPVPVAENPVVLVVDGIDVITRPDLARGFESFIEQLAGRIGLVVLGRNTAHVPLYRVGMRVGLAEITPDELSCTDEEIAGFLAAWRSDPVPEDWIRMVADRAEGWAGGIRLAGLTLSELGATLDISECLRTDRGLIADYFEKEVLDEQPDDIREFLCRTSVLEEMRPDVCNLLCGRNDALMVLEALVKQNLFVRQPGGREAFRYHPLFKEFLRHQMALRGADAATQARLLAARSLERNGDTIGAMAQLRAAGAHDELFALGLRGLQQSLDVRHSADSHIMLPAGIPSTYFEHSALRMYPLCASHLLRLDLDQAATWLRRMEWAVDAESDYGSPLHARCELLWAMYDLALVNGEGVLRHLAAVQRFLDPNRPAQFHGSLRGPQWVRELDSALILMAPMFEAQAELWLGRTGKAAQILADAYGVDHAATDPLLSASFGSVLLAEGQLRQAEDLCRTALSGVEEDGLVDSPATVGIRLVAAQVLYERDDLAGAEDQLGTADRICRAAGQDRWRVGIECERARIDLAHERIHEALRRLDGIRRDEPLNRNLPLQELSHEIEVRCRLALGDLLGAEDLLLDRGDGFTPPELLARFHLAAGRPDRASAELGRSGFTARGRPSIERLLLQTRVFLQAGNRRAAEHSLQRAVNLARSDGYVRVFLDEPKQITDLLWAVSAGGADAFVEHLLSRVSIAKPGGPGQLSILEPLTERERELLGYLPCHLSQSEIASKMFISANTVKTHMKGLYRKLGATSRSEAVYIARDCGLLSSSGV